MAFSACAYQITEVVAPMGSLSTTRSRPSTKKTFRRCRPAPCALNASAGAVTMTEQTANARTGAETSIGGMPNDHGYPFR
jgi:hypothetical protein